MYLYYFVFVFLVFVAFILCYFKFLLYFYSKLRNKRKAGNRIHWLLLLGQTFSPGSFRPLLEVASTRKLYWCVHRHRKNWFQHWSIWSAHTVAIRKNMETGWILFVHRRTSTTLYTIDTNINPEQFLSSTDHRPGWNRRANLHRRKGCVYVCLALA